MQAHRILQSSSNLFNIKWDKSCVDSNFNDYPKIVYHNNMYYLLYKGLYSVPKRNPKEWARMEDIGHFDAMGVSLTSTPDGLVLYGGKSDDTYYKDMWIYSGDWKPIINQSPRAFHAVCAIPEKSAILIHGGINNGEVLSDCILLDINTGAVTPIQLSQKLAFSHHTITAIGENNVYLFGGIDENGHLNSKLYSIRIDGGAVEEVSNSLDTLPTAARCSHHAFSFFNFLCVASGFQSGDKLHNCALYDFSHNVWLEIPFCDYMKNAWFIHSNPKGFCIFDSNAKAYQEIYFNQNMQPLVDINDPQLLTFFSRLLNYNISYVFLQEETKQLEKNITSVRKDTSRVFTNKLPTNNPAPKITKLMSEMEELEQAKARLTDDYNKQQWHIRKVYQNAKDVTSDGIQNNRSANPPSDPTVVVQQLTKEKQDNREAIKKLKEQIQDSMGKLETITPLFISPKTAQIALYDNQTEKDSVIKITNPAQIEEGIQNAQKSINRLQIQYEDLKSHKHRIESNTSDALIYLQNLYRKSHQEQLVTNTKRRKFFEFQRTIIQKQSEEIELEMSKLDEIKKDYDSYVRQRMRIESLISQITKLESEKEKYENTMPDLLRQLSEHMNSIINSPNPKSEIDATLDLINEITEVQKNAQDKISKLDDGNDQTPPKAEERWGLYYKNILNILDNISEAEKKTMS